MPFKVMNLAWNKFRIYVKNNLHTVWPAKSIWSTK